MLGIFAELMHVDDVHDAAQPVQRAQRSAPLDAGLQREKKEDRGGEQNDVIHGGLADLQQIADALHADGDSQSEARQESGDAEDADNSEGGSNSEEPDGAA